MTVQFPQVQPTDHEYVAPDWPVTESRSQGGVRSVRLWGDKASDAGMVLSFANITQSAAVAILNAHNNAKGRVEDVSFPPVVVKGIEDPQLLALLRDGGPGLKWYFNGPPQATRVKGGRRISIRAEFRAELRM
jgi:hypothetical protein